MSADETESGAQRDLSTWFAGRRSEVERWVEETCQRAITGVRSVLAEEIRGLARRVEKMHELLDHLEQVVESGPEPGGERQETEDDAGES